MCSQLLSLAIFCVAFRSQTLELTNWKSLERTWEDRESGMGMLSVSDTLRLFSMNDVTRYTSNLLSLVIKDRYPRWLIASGLY
jgi:hypothetical protein